MYIAFLPKQCKTSLACLMDAAAGWMCDTCNYYSIINYQCDNSAQLCCVPCWYCGLWLWLRNPIIRSQNVQCDWIWKYQIPAPVVQCICCLPNGSTIARGLFTSKMKIDSDSLTLYAVVSLSLCGVELVGCQEAVPAYERWCKQIAHTHTRTSHHIAIKHEHKKNKRGNERMGLNKRITVRAKTITSLHLLWVLVCSPLAPFVNRVVVEVVFECVNSWLHQSLIDCN